MGEGKQSNLKKYNIISKRMLKSDKFVLLFCLSIYIYSYLKGEIIRKR